MREQVLIQKAEQSIREHFKNPTMEQLHYHNIEHTEIVVERVIQALHKQEMRDEEKNNVIIAAWFHDVGYLYDYDNHEEKSIELCTEFLRKKQIDENRINEICKMINSTKFQVIPRNEKEALLKDIDIAYALYTNFNSKGDLLKKEKEIKLNKQIDDAEWTNSQITFLNEIRFYSSYGRESFNKILEKTRRKASQ